MVTKWNHPFNRPLVRVALAVALACGTAGLAQAAEFTVLNLKGPGDSTRGPPE